MALDANIIPTSKFSDTSSSWRFDSSFPDGVVSVDDCCKMDGRSSGWKHTIKGNVIVGWQNFNLIAYIGI